MRELPNPGCMLKHTSSYLPHSRKSLQLDKVNHLYQSHRGSTGLIQPCIFLNMSIMVVKSQKHFSCHESINTKMIFQSYLETAMNTKVETYSTVRPYGGRYTEGFRGEILAMYNHSM